MPAPAGTPVTLTGAGATTGVTVTLSKAGKGFHPGDFWRFALRPSKPDLIYPARYGVASQPPDGARVHACPIALVTWPAQGSPVVTSCIPGFDNLVDLTGREGGCECTICLTPTASTTLQDAVTQLQTTGGTICLTAGVYLLTEPVAMDGCQNVRIRGQGNATLLLAPNGAFTVGGCIGCTIEDLAIISGGANASAAAIAFSGTLGTTLQHTTILALAPSPPTNTGAAGMTSPATSTAVTIDGIQWGLTIRDNVITASVGITTAPPSEAGGVLLAIGTRINSNTFTCSQTAILLQSNVVASQPFYVVWFAFGADFNDNSITTPPQAPTGDGIRVVGSIFGGGALRIAGNDIQVAGNAIVTSPSNSIVARNTITASASALAPGGIGLINDTVSIQTGPAAAIDDNTVTGVAIAIAAGFFSTVSIEVLRISQNIIANCSVTGIVVATAGGVAISDNTIDGSSIIGAALFASGSAIDVSGNLITNLNPDNTGEGQPAPTGIDIQAPFTSVDVSHNQIQLVSKPSGSLTALLVNGSNSPTTTVSITDNILNGIGGVPAVSIEGVQDLHFAGNEITNPLTTFSRVAAVQVTTDLQNATVRCHGNRVRYGNRKTTSISISGPTPNVNPEAAILGNITTGPITPLPAPWSTLNIIAP
jgi:hypothetical protein